MASNLPLPTYILLNQEQKNEIPDYSQKIYEIKDNTPLEIKNINNIVVVRETPISNFPTIILPQTPTIGTIVDIAQGRTNNLVMCGNGKNILINYIKYATNNIATFSDSNILIDSGESFAPNTQCSFSVTYNGEEWQNLNACILVNIQTISNESSLTASREYGMIQEAGKSPILLTFTYSDNLGNLYSGKTIEMTSNKSASIINPVSAVTDNLGEAKFNVSSPQLGATIFTAHFLNLAMQPVTLNITIDFYNDDSTVVSDSNIVPIGEAANITVTIKDTNNDLYSGKNVACYSNEPTDLVSVISNPTGVNGEAKFTVVADSVHVSTISAQNVTDSYNIANTTEITFIDVPPIPVLPTDSLAMRYESDVGVYDYGTGEVIYWQNQINGNFLARQSSILKTGAFTPSGQPALYTAAGTMSDYRDYFGGPVVGYSDRTLCIIGKFPKSGQFIYSLGSGDGVQFRGGTRGTGTNIYMTCSVYSPEEIEIYPYDDNWHLYVFTNATNIYTNYYLDNTLLGASITGVPFISASRNYYLVNSSPSENGYIAALYGYDKVLSEEERTDLYNYVVYKFGI
jgi:hypothetical protein